MARRLWSQLLVWGVLLAFGLSYGLNYGVSNHTFYLLPSERLLHPELWKNDWAVTQTHFYHTLFAWLAAGMLELDPSGWLIALLNVAAIAGGMACVWALLGRLVSAGQAVLALLLVVLIAAATRTDGPGLSYVFSTTFQPNTLGSVGLLAAAWFLVAGRPLASGLALAFMGAFHANYLVLCLPVFGVAALGEGRAGLVRRLCRQLGPPLVVLLLHLPVILATSSAPVVAEAQRIYQDIRSPHHYRIENFARQFVPWVGWQLIGAGAILDVLRDRAHFRRLFSLLVGFWVLIVPSVVLLSVLVVRPLIQLYPWRLTVNAELLAQTAFAAAVITRVLSPSAWPKPSRVAAALLLLGGVLVGIGAFQARKLLPFEVALIGGALLFFAERLSAVPGLMARAPAGLLTVLLVALVVSNVHRFTGLSRSSSLLGGRDGGVQELCRWLAANTTVDALLLTPPDEERIRFQCRRAIVVDWKTAPMLPGEVLDWYGRVEDVTGRKPLQSARDLAGYQTLDRERLARLRTKYHFDYVVTHHGSEQRLGLEPSFRGQRFVAYALGPER